MRSFKQIASLVRGEDFLEEGLKPGHKLRPGWMLKTDPKLGAAVAAAKAKYKEKKELIGTKTNEEVEKIEELNRDTINSYAKKSEKDQDKQFTIIGKSLKDNDPKSGNKAGHKFSMRSIGLNRAEKRLGEETKDIGEYDYEGQMARTQLQTTLRNCEDLIGMINDDDNMPEWVQSKITLAQDYITTVRDYLQSKEELGEEVKDEYARKVDKYLKKKHGKDDSRNKLPQGAEYAAQRRKDRLANNGRMDEDIEHLDEMPGANMDTRAVHSHLKKKGWSLARTSGGHDVFTHPNSAHHIPVPRHRQLKAPLIKGILKSSQINEESEQIDELSKKTLGSYVNKAMDSARELPGSGTNAEASKKSKRFASVSAAAYRTQGLAPRKGTDMFKKYNTESIVAEMDKSQTPPGRDGHVSHGTYGSRDEKDPDAGKKQYYGKMERPEKTTKRALDIFNKAFNNTSKKQGVAEGKVVPLGKKHKGDLGDIHSCPKCGGDLQGGTYMGHRVKVCHPCSQVYLPPNSGIDQKGNKTNEQATFKKSPYGRTAASQQRAKELLNPPKPQEPKKDEQGVAETTGDKPFDNMMKNISKGTNKQKTADRKEQQKQTQQRARDAFGNMFGGGNPADKLKIREQSVAEAVTYEPSPGARPNKAGHTLVGFSFHSDNTKHANIMKHGETGKYFAAGGSSSHPVKSTTFHDTPEDAVKSKKSYVKEEVGQATNSNEDPNKGRFMSAPAKKVMKPSPMVTSEQSASDIGEPQREIPLDTTKTNHSTAMKIAKSAARRQARIKEDLEADNSIGKNDTLAKQSLSRTAGITKDLALNGKNKENVKNKEKFEPEPELSSQIVKP